MRHMLKGRVTQPAARTTAILVVALSLSGCASKHSHADNAYAGMIGGAVAGGTIGAVCCGNPVVGLPAGMLIGGAAGGVGGLVWPSEMEGSTY